MPAQTSIRVAEGVEVSAYARTQSIIAPLAIAATLAAAPPAPPAPARYALVVGVDDYEPPINDLRGAVNDAKDIASALEKSGADRVALLLNKEVTRAAGEGAWTEV